MKLKYTALILFILMNQLASGQLFKLSGFIYNTKKEPLALASVEIKELKKGSVSKDDGSFTFYVERGKYEIIVSMIGYSTKIVPVYINNEDIAENIILEEDTTTSLSEVIIKVKARDRAEEIIRNVIRNKDAITEAAGSYSCTVYIKAFREDSVHSKRITDTVKAIPADEMYKGMSLAEISIRLDQQSNGQIKEERLGVNKRGSAESLFFLTTTDGDFNLYNNQIKSPSVSEIPFVSPISYSGLLAYRFKTLNIDRTGKHKIYTISVRPRLLSNATIDGELVIEDSSFTILRATYRLPSGHLPEYDYFEVQQQYEKVRDTAWMITRQQFNYYSKIKGGRRYGETTVFYSDFELNKQFKKGYFGNELSATTSEAYEKDSVFWNRVRTEPLSVQQSLYARYQDSIYQYMRSEAYLDSMDQLLNRITWKNVVFFGQTLNDHKKERTWILPPVPSLFIPVAFGGPRIRVAAAYRKTFTSRKNISIELNSSYGFRNKDVNGYVKAKGLYNPFSRGKISLKAGRWFEFIYPGDAWINVLKRSNIYLNNSFEVGHEIELFNGLVLMNNFEVALRRSVSDYKVNNKADTIFGIPNEPAVEFDPYNASYAEVKLYYTPAQKYIREPREKIILGSRWPTFYAIWKKGIPDLLNSKINFDYTEFGIMQQINLGVVGNTNYTIKSGDFVRKKDLRIIDYRFQKQGDPLFFQDPQKVFQTLDSTFPVFERFYQANLVHEFNGYLLSKIPFLKKLQLQEVAGGGLLVAPERDLRFVELFAGIERVFKWPFNPLAKVKIGIYVAGSVANKYNNPLQFKVGLTTWDRFQNNWR